MLEILQQHIGALIPLLHGKVIEHVGVNTVALEQAHGIRPVAAGHHRLQVVGRLAEGAVGEVVQPAQSAQAGGAPGGQHIGGPVAHLVLLLGGHLGHQPVEGGVGLRAFAMPAFVVEGDEPWSPHPLARGRGGAVVTLGVRQGEGVPDRRLDGILQILVAVPPALVAVRQLDLGEEIAAEGLPAQLADIALLAPELLLGLRRHRRARTGGGDAVGPPEVRSVGHAEGAAPEEQHHQQDHQKHDQELAASGLFRAWGAASAGDRLQQHGPRRKRRRDHHRRRLPAVRVHAAPPLEKRHQP